MPSRPRCTELIKEGRKEGRKKGKEKKYKKRKKERENKYTDERKSKIKYDYTFLELKEN